MDSSKLTEVINAKGHRNILATHPTTFEITKQDKLARKGDCIIAVSANKALADLNEEFKMKLRKDTARLKIVVAVGGETEVIHAQGSSNLRLLSPSEMVIRKSDYSCYRTLALGADKASSDIARTLVQELKSPDQKVKITLSIIS
jgi:hypothetical protein